MCGEKYTLDLRISECSFKVNFFQETLNLMGMKSISGEQVNVSYMLISYWWDNHDKLQNIHHLNKDM